MLRVVLFALCASAVGGMDGAGASGFARARGGDVRSNPKPHPYFPFHDLLILGNRRSGKTTVLLWLLMFRVTELLLRQYYKEVIIICTNLEHGYNREQSSDWSLFKHLYQIGDNMQSPDGFFKCYTTMTMAVWEQIKRRTLANGFRLVICDDVLADDAGREWFAKLDGGQRPGIAGSQMMKLDKTPPEGAQCHMWVVAHRVVSYLGRGVKQHIADSGIMLFHNICEDRGLFQDVFGNKQLINYPTPTKIMKMWDSAFPWQRFGV